MRRNVVIAVVVVLLLAVAVVWRLKGRGDDNSSGPEHVGSGEHGGAGGGGTGARASGPRAPAAPASIGGRVFRKADGSGVPGAIVTLGRAELDALFGGKHEEPLSATTDQQGAWRVEKVPPGRYTIGATATGLVPASLDRVVIAEGEKRDGLDIALEAGGNKVSGTVSDVGGGPVPGARVTVRRKSGDPFGAAGYAVSAGPDGKYEVMLKDDEYDAYVTHDDYTHAVRHFEVAGAPLTMDFVLLPGASIRGVVVTRDGKPVPEARVIASSGRGIGPGAAAGGGGMTVTDAKGEFSLTSLGAGAISLTASARGYASGSPTVVELGIGEQIDGVRVIVDRAFSISGRCVEKGTQKGIAGVRLGAFSIGTAQFALAPDPSDDQGRFEIVGVKPASYMLFAISEEVMPEIGQPVEVVDKDVTGVTVEMGIGVTVSGRVEPGTLAEVTIEPTAVGIGNIFEAVKALLVRAQTDGTGAFTLRHVPPGSFTLRASVSDGRAGELPLLVDKVDKTGVVIKLEPRASIAGRVIDANGAAVGGVRVRAREKGDKDRMSMRMSPRGDDGAVTAPDGTFRIVGLDEGVQELRVSDDQGTIPWADGVKRAKPKDPIEITLAKAEAKTGVTLTVEARDGVIRGVVVGPDKAPVADAWVTARVESDSKREDIMIEIGAEMRSMNGKPPTLTGADGTFVFDHLRRGNYTLVAETAKGTARIEQKHVVLGSTVTLVLAPLGTLTGHVTISGTAVPSFNLSCDTSSTRMPRQFTAPDGAFSLERIPPGHLHCTATSPAGRGTGEVDVPAGPATLDIALSPWATITGTVVSVLDGKPIEGLKILATTGEMSEKAITDTLSGKGPTSDTSGRFVISEVGAGKGAIAVMSKDAGFVELAHRDYEVTTGQRLDLGIIKVVPPRTGDAGTLGMSTSLDGEILSVATVKPGGPAEAGGVQVGDKLVAINGVPVTTLTPKLAQTLVSSGSVTIGQSYQLTLDRAGARVEVVLVGVRW